MCGRLTVYNTYATLSYTNPIFMGFSRYQNVDKEIIVENMKMQINLRNIMFLGFFFCPLKRGESAANRVEIC